MSTPAYSNEGGSGDARFGKHLNQFTFCDRGSQTHTNQLRDHETFTEDPPQNSYKDICNLWIIYDAYQADAANHLKHKEAAARPSIAPGEGDENPDEGEKKTVIKEIKKEKDFTLPEKSKVIMRKSAVIEGQAAGELPFLRATDSLKFLERLVAFNNTEDIFFDFKYFEDNSDPYRDDGEGTLLPLWRFLYDKARKKHVTGISWSETQPDFFAVSFGSFSFIHPVQMGLVVVYSLRNPLFPEHIWQKDKGALCCHIHPMRANLVCIGLCDGNLAVLNLEKDRLNQCQSEVYENRPVLLKHTAPVWSVKWGKDDLDGNATFISAGMDGRIIQWTVDVVEVDGGGLDGNEISTLFLPQISAEGPDGTIYKLFGCARCISFHPTETRTYLIGTAEGKIFIASTDFGDKLLKVYSGHYLPVAAVQWNHYHSEVFISCSEDWTIKVWDRRDLNPMFTFETGVPIMEVCWAPYSSCVFGCITLEGKLLVYDLNVSREIPICAQQVATKKKIHPFSMQFNPKYPIIAVGDDRGSVLTLKLSPNLRILPKDANGNPLTGDARLKSEINKLGRILKLVRDPSIVSNPKPEELPLVTNLEDIPGKLSKVT